MFRLAITALVIYLLWTLLKWVFRGLSGARRRPQATEAPTLEAAEMVACSACGTFVVRGDAIRQGNNDFCSRECAAKA